MSRRYLFGPITGPFADQNLHRARAAGECLAFGPGPGVDLVVGPGDGWETLCGRLPDGWRPQFVALWLGYTHVPAYLWSTPLPLLGLAPDYNLLWHYFRHALPACDLVLTDTPGVEALARAGIAHARPANLFGAERALLGGPWPEAARDIDVLFVGNLDRAVQRERLPWLARLAKLGRRRRVAIRAGAWGEEYRSLLGRARVVFNRSIRGECNRRAFEAAAAGALLFQEAGNREVPAYFEAGRDYVAYADDDLEGLLEHYLGDEGRRRAVAESARAKVARYGFADLWERALGQVERDWLELQGRAGRRQAPGGAGWLHGRLWQQLGCGGAADPSLPLDLAAALAVRPGDAGLGNALGVAGAALAQAQGGLTADAVHQAAGHFRRAVAADPGHAVAALNLAEALFLLGDRPQAAQAARAALDALGRSAGLPAAVLDAGHFPPGFDLFRVEWERVGWQSGGRPAAEATAKGTLLRWRLHTLLAECTGELAHFHEAALARPDLPTARAALGCALARAGRHADALPHLRQAVADDPFDAPAARALYQLLGAVGDADGQRRLARDRRLLAQAAPQAVAAEPWLAEAPLAGDELASLVILCCDQLDYTRLCLESVLAHTRAAYELILVDNGSSDGTPDYLEEVRRRPGPERVVVLRNEANRGFAVGVNQGLAAARGEYLVLLNNDTVVTPGWLEGLVHWALHDWPHTGLVGPVTSWSAPPQIVEVDYADLSGLDAFAARRAREFAGQALRVERLTGFCLLVRRDVLDKVGGLDERFGLGFFEDDDLGVRARQAGYRLAVALDVFVHHFGNRTFAGLGLDAERQLQENFELFKTKWGEEHAARYRLPEQPPQAPAPSQPPTVGEGDTAGTPASGRPKVSLCMIVKNEAANLGPCLASVADLVDEMVVIDTGSADATKEVAARAGARVHDFAWQDSFAAARNESVRHATGDWVIWLDADEYLDEPNRARLRSLLAALPRENVAYVMRQRSPLEEGPHAAVHVDQVRLFRRLPGLVWEYRVHEQVLPCLRRLGAEVRHTNVIVEHKGFAAPTLQGPKVERNLRLLHLELAERPDDSFVLYNLGAVHLTQGQAEEALAYLRRSLACAQPGDTLVPKLHALVVRAHHQLGEKDQALAACREGLRACPEDAELFFWQAVLLRERNDLGGCEASLLRVLTGGRGRNFAASDAGLQGYRSRCFLAEVYRDQGRPAEAEGQWRAALAECPGFTPAWRALAGLWLEQGRWPELQEAAAQMKQDPEAAADADLLLARAHLARKEFGPARALLEGLAAAHPQVVGPRVVLSYVLLQEGSDPQAAERALRAVLALDPGNAEAAHNLAVLLARQGRAQPAGGEGNGEPLPVPLVVSANGAARPKVSLCMIVRDEEANLPDCLASVADLVDEVVVVDTGSTDQTKEVAARFGAKVFDFAWVDSFAAARNESLRHARGDWVLWMDADDRLDEDNRAQLRQLLASLGEERAGYVMKCLCLPDPVTNAPTVVDHLRLFRNLPGVCWRYRVHEQVLPALRQAGAEVRWSDVVVTHAGYADPALRSRKLQRDLRLLQLELAEQPDDPFTLFNLGSVYQELGRLADAVPLFCKSLARSQLGDSIVRKLYALIAQCHNRLGQAREAVAVCCEGLGHFPDDAELLFQKGVICRGLGDRAGAKAAWEAALAAPEGAYFASVHTGLRGHLTRHNLAAVCLEEGDLAGAETHWRAALEDRPDYEPAWLGLAEVYLAAGHWGLAEGVAARLEEWAWGAVPAAVLRGRVLLARQEFAAARALLEAAVARFPQAVWPRQVLTHALLQEGRDWDAAERALRELLGLDPDNREARSNLAVLLRRQGREAEAEEVSLPTLGELYRSACQTPSDINEHCPTLYELARGCRHLTELGTRTGVSTAALLYAQPDKLVCYDKQRYPQVDVLAQRAGRTEFVFRQEDVLRAEIEETDLLFIDTWHVYDQLKEELRRHAGKVRKYVVLHDTTTYGAYGESPGHRGLWPAVEEFLAGGTFRLKERYENNNGLTVLERA